MIWKNLKRLSIGSGRQIGCVVRRFLTSEAPRVGIVGSGPAGFYTAQYILKHHPSARIDIFEKLPVPFGLVRYGVAPDHPEVKNATNTFEEVSRNDRFRFFGNVNVGKDVNAVDLQNAYHAVVFAYGADDDKQLHIPGEDAKSVISARSFVGWYNGLPAHAELDPDLNCETVVVIGHGNVALDVARILLAPQKLLEHTDICQHALEALQKSSIKRVILAGRRGPFEVSFTIKELREMIRLEGTKPNLHSEDFKHVRAKIPEIARQRRRLMELMCQTALDEPKEKDRLRYENATREWGLEFLVSPSEVLIDGDNKVTGVRFQKNELVKDEDGSQVAKATDKFIDIECGMVLRSIGYKSIPLQEGVPFDVRLGVIPNINGRVVEAAGSKNIVKGLYCSGWVKHGPVGVIVTTMNEAFDTADTIVKDLHSDFIGSDQKIEDISNVLEERGINYISYEDYQRIDIEELWRGKQSHKPREKIVSTNEMLNIASRDDTKKEN